MLYCIEQTIEYQQCIGYRPVQFIKVSRGFSSKWYVSFEYFVLWFETDDDCIISRNIEQYKRF